MKTVIEKNKLLDIIKTNREEHIDTYSAAVVAYAEKGVDLLERLIKKLKAGEIIRNYLELPAPEDHTDEYDRAIRMLELDSRDAIELNEQEFRQFVQDDWDWKQSWISSTRSYVVEE